jgi:hypothetical protein
MQSRFFQENLIGLFDATSRGPRPTPLVAIVKSEIFMSEKGDNLWQPTPPKRGNTWLAPAILSALIGAGLVASHYLTYKKGESDGILLGICGTNPDNPEMRKAAGCASYRHPKYEGRPGNT